MSDDVAQGSDGWVHEPKTYRTFNLDKEGRKFLETFFNERRNRVFHDPDKQAAFMRLLDGIISFANVTRNGLSLNDPDHPKLKPGERHDAHEINMAKLIARNIAVQFEQTFQTPASGKENSVFFQLVNEILGQMKLETEDGRPVQLGKDVLKTALSGKARKKD